MTLHSTGSFARTHGLHRDAVLNYLKAGMPEPSARVAGRRVFTPDDVAAACRWMDAHGKPYRKINEPVAV